jgi:hypothetical protein
MMQALKWTEPEYWQAPEDVESLANRTTARLAAIFRLGEEDDAEAPLAEVLKMPPDYVIVRHAHNCHRFEMVATGSLYFEGKILEPGDVMVAAPGEFYGPKVAGPDGCISVEVFAKGKGVMGAITYELPDGGTVDVTYLNGDKRPEDDGEIAAARAAAARAYAAAGEPSGA